MYNHFQANTMCTKNIKMTTKKTYVIFIKFKYIRAHEWESKLPISRRRLQKLLILLKRSMYSWNYYKYIKYIYSIQTSYHNQRPLMVYCWTYTFLWKGGFGLPYHTDKTVCLKVSFSLKVKLVIFNYLENKIVLIL